MVVHTSICMVFPCTGPMKRLRFPIGTSKGFLHNFRKRFICWKSINISLATSFVPYLDQFDRPFCLASFQLSCFCHMLSFLSRKHKKMQRETYFQIFCVSDNHGKIFVENGFTFLIKQCVTFRSIYILLPFHNIVNGKGEYKCL